MKRNFYILIALSCFFCNAYHNDERNSLDEKEMLRLMHLQESLYAEQDTISFLQFRSLFPCAALSDSSQSVNSGKTIPMKPLYQKYLSKELISNTGVFLCGNFFYYDNYYVAFFDYMEELPSNRLFYTHILLYNQYGTILKDICVLNGQDEPDFIGEWYVCASSIIHRYYGPYNNNDSFPVNCKETIYSLALDSPLTKTEEHQFSTIKSFVW